MVGTGINSTDGRFDDVCLLVVDGFNQVSPLQARLISALAEQVPDTLIALTGNPTHRPIHRAFDRMRTRLQKFTEYDISYDYVPPQTTRHPVLDHMEAQFGSMTPTAIHADERVTLIEAPNHEAEVRGVLREIKQAILDGEAPETMLIVARRVCSHIARCWNPSGQNMVSH